MLPFATNKMTCLVSTVCLLAAVQLTYAASCPEPSSVDVVDVGSDFVTFRWNATEHLPSPLHCACGFPGVYANVCSADANSSDCSEGVTGLTTTQLNLRPGYTHTVCVQTQCSPANFSSPVCRTVRTLASEPAKKVPHLEVSSGGTKKLEAFWTNIHDAGDSDDGVVKHYEVSWWKRGPRQDSAPAEGKTTALTNGSSITVDQLKPHTTYAVQVVAVWQSGNTTVRRPSKIATTTTYPEGLVRVSDVTLSTTNRKPSLCDVSAKWTVTAPDPEAVEHHKYRVTLCVGSQALADEGCLNTTVQGGRTRVTFPGVRNFATLFASVRPVFKIPGNEFEGEASVTLGTSWTPELPRVEDLVVSEVTGKSAHVSWSKLAELDGVAGAHYRVRLSANENQRPAEDAGTNVVEEQLLDAGEGVLEQYVVREVPASNGGLDLVDLKPWTNYAVTVTPGVTAIGVAAVGESANTAFETPAEPPSKPRSVSVVEREGARYLTWLPPESWNGPRTGYEVSVACVEDNVRTSRPSVVLSPEATELVAPSVSPTKSCTLGVRAFNVYRGESLDGDVVWVRLTPTRSEDVAVAQLYSNEA
ncbi:uncharacterized protein LOC119164530 [Rhipicephalus microplus]|uniref:uncharacterized protein LOC119164530 n=1 Tax=Rhipicephalus microplus TaxID=6941 RepID=UPI003F6BD2BA